MEIFIIVMLAVIIIETTIGLILCVSNYRLDRIADELDQENDRLYDDMVGYRAASARLAKENMDLEREIINDRTEIEMLNRNVIENKKRGRKVAKAKKTSKLDK